MNQNYNLMRLANLYGGMNKSAVTTSPMLLEGAKLGDYNKFRLLLEINGTGVGVSPEIAAEAKKLLADHLLERKFNSVLNDYARRAGSDETLTEAAKLNPQLRPGIISKSVASGDGNPMLGALNKLTPDEQNLIIDQHAKQRFKQLPSPSTWESVKNWIAANPGTSAAIGAGALGLGGYGAYKALSDDEEEERKKSASSESLTLSNDPALWLRGKAPSVLDEETGTLTMNPAVIAAATEGAPPPGYTLGTEELAMQRFKEELAKDPSLLEKIKAWISANPGTSAAIGAGALGLGGLGAYAMMNNDEEELRKKSASYIDPYTAQVLAHDYITKMARANGIPAVAAGVTGVSNYLSY